MSIDLTQTLIFIGVVVFIVLIVWSRIMNQRMIDTVMEIKEMFTRIGK